MTGLFSHADDGVQCGFCGEEFADMDRLVDHLSDNGVFDRLIALPGDPRES